MVLRQVTHLYHEEVNGGRLASMIVFGLTQNWLN